MLESLRARIAGEGPLRFDRYWDHVLYAPGLGYYAAGATKLGGAGDFVTAPELGPVFARCCADSFAAVLRGAGGGDIVEFGAGTGAFAVAALERLRALDALPERYRIIERSADLAERQHARLAAAHPDLTDRIEWLAGLPDRPWCGVMFANEVLDALAPRRLRFEAGRWSELFVDLDASDKLAWKAHAASDALQPWLARIEAHWPSAPTSQWSTEIQPAIAPWVASATDKLEVGAVLLCDYGYPTREYYQPERADGTLICHFRHRAHADPFLHPGLTDLSVSVDFGEAARAIEAAGLTPAGFVTQADFLLATGLEREAEAAFELPEVERLARINEIKRLTLPSQMGERFRLIAGVRGLEPPLVGLPTRSWLEP